MPNSRKVKEIRGLIIKESEVSANADNKDTADLLDEGCEQLEIWHTDDSHQEDGNTE